MNGLTSGNSIAKPLVWALAIFGAAVAMPAWAELKIGVVDFGKLAEESPQAKAAQDALRAEFGNRQRDLQNMQQTLKTKDEKLQKDAATMTEDQKSRADKELRDSVRELQRKQGEMQDDLNVRRNEEMSKLQRTLTDTVRVFAKAQSFDLVVADGVIYATPTIDITPQILAALQQRGGAAKPAGASAPVTPGAPSTAPPAAKPQGR